MNKRWLFLAGAGGLLLSLSAGAVPANPRAMAGVDHLKPDVMNAVLVPFCKTNGCKVQYITQYAKQFHAYLWNIWLKSDSNIRPISLETPCELPHQYCIYPWGKIGDTFMNKTRFAELRHALEAKGATVTPLDCKVEPTPKGFAWVCAHSRPKP